MRKKKPIDYRKYPVRMCMTCHHCEICKRSIVIGETYYDGGYSRRAHVNCVDKPPWEVPG